MKIKIKIITFMGVSSVLTCDAKCDLAWGINGGRYRFNDDGFTDAEMGKAPTDPGTYEGGHGKPTDGNMNKWCARECERSALEPFECGNGVQLDIELPKF